MEAGLPGAVWKGAMRMRGVLLPCTPIQDAATIL